MAVAMTRDAIDDLRRIPDYPRPPVKRAAYSDRAAWLMAIMAELAYTRFDQEDDSSILTLARELAELTDREQIVERLRGLAALLGSAREGGATEDNALLRSGTQRVKDDVARAIRLPPKWDMTDLAMPGYVRGIAVYASTAPSLTLPCAGGCLGQSVLDPGRQRVDGGCGRPRE